MFSRQKRSWVYGVRRVPRGESTRESPHVPSTPAVMGLPLGEGQRYRVRGKGESGQRDCQGGGNVS